MQATDAASACIAHTPRGTPCGCFAGHVWGERGKRRYSRWGVYIVSISIPYICCLSMAPIFVNLICDWRILMMISTTSGNPSAQAELPGQPQSNWNSFFVCFFTQRTRFTFTWTFIHLFVDSQAKNFSSSLCFRFLLIFAVCLIDVADFFVRPPTAQNEPLPPANPLEPLLRFCGCPVAGN